MGDPELISPTDHSLAPVIVYRTPYAGVFSEIHDQTGGEEKFPVHDRQQKQHKHKLDKSATLGQRTAPPCVLYRMVWSDNFRDRTRDFRLPPEFDKQNWKDQSVCMPLRQPNPPDRTGANNIHTSTCRQNQSNQHR
jgi:hypothetical protein